jgi:hypothetical protein
MVRLDETTVTLLAEIGVQSKIDIEGKLELMIHVLMFCLLAL